MRKYFKKTDKLFWLISLAVSIYSLLLLKSVSRNGDRHFTTQLFAIAVGYIGAYFITKIDYQVVSKRWYIPASICIVLLAYSLIFGIAASGEDGVNARAWIMLPGNITFQPSELAKIGFIITFSQHLYYVKEQGKLESFTHILLLFAHVMVPMVITHFQGDDGAAIIFFCMFLIMTFAAGVQLRYFAGVLLAGVLVFPLAWKYNLLSEYQKKRLSIQFDLESDPLHYGLQQLQGRLSIASGKLFGRGLFKGPRVGSQSVPIAQSDFIFSVVGEELGFVGCVLVMLLLFLIIVRAFKVALVACDDLGKYICYGFAGLILSQAVFNLGMCLNVMPVMGVTLPFFSAGGSSAACLYLGIGLVQNVFMHKDNKDLISLSVLKQSV